MVLIEEFCTSGTGSLFGRNFFYNLTLMIPIAAHYIAFHGIRNRKVYQLAVFLGYSVSFFGVIRNFVYNLWVSLQEERGI
jgi:hypothetical protein